MKTMPKSKVCRVCKADFAPQRPMQKVCCPTCALALAQSDRVKATRRGALKTRREARQRLESIKSRAEWLQEAQAAVNRYARLRDWDRGCVSCDRPANWDGQWHASHYRSVGAASAVRFNLWNIHKSCSICNHHLSGNISRYRPALIARIGQQKFDWLESQNQTVRYDIEYLKRLKTVFTKRANRLARRIQGASHAG
jgi:hypothetical protein